MAKEGKTKKKIRSITPQRKEELGLRLESLIKKELAYIIYQYKKSYIYAVKATFGWEEEDLDQFIKMSLWRGIVTYDKQKKIKEITYLSKVLRNSFYNLAKKCRTVKHGLSKLFFPEDLYDCDELTLVETPEDWAKYIKSFSKIQGNLNKEERIVLINHLVGKKSIYEISRQLKKTKPEVIKIIKNIKEKMELSLGVLDEE